MTQIPNEEEINYYPNFLNKDFVQIRRLDKGAFGKIFLARRKDDSKIYILKMMFGVTNEEITRIKDEIVVLASINHKHVVRYLDAWIETMEMNEYNKYYKENEEDSEDEITESMSSYSSYSNSYSIEKKKTRNESNFEESFTNSFGMNFRNSYEEDVEFESDSENEMVKEKKEKKNGKKQQIVSAAEMLMQFDDEDEMFGNDDFDNWNDGKKEESEEIQWYMSDDEEEIKETKEKEEEKQKEQMKSNKSNSLILESMKDGKKSIDIDKSIDIGDVDEENEKSEFSEGEFEEGDEEEEEYEYEYEYVTEETEEENENKSEESQTEENIENEESNEEDEQSDKDFDEEHSNEENNNQVLSNEVKIPVFQNSQSRTSRSTSRNTGESIQERIRQSFDESNTNNEKGNTNSIKVIVIQMEYCSGNNLNKIIQSQELLYTKKDAEEKINSYFKQIVIGLEYIHSQNIIHGDLKPANIFREGDVLKIGDFGYSQMRMQTNKCAFAGTIGYAAPEISSGKYDISSDIYSLGIILFEMCLSSVTRSEFIMGIEALKKKQTNEIITKYYPQYTELIFGMIHENPNKRPTAKDILKQLSGIEETKKKMEHIKPLLKNHQLVFPSLISQQQIETKKKLNKSLNNSKNQNIIRPQHQTLHYSTEQITAIKQIETITKECNEKMGCIQCYFYPIIPLKYISDDQYDSPIVINSKQEMMIVLNTFVDLLKVVFTNRKKITSTDSPLHVQIPLYQFNDSSIESSSSLLYLKPSIDDSLSFDLLDTFQEVIELVQKITSKPFKIQITNAQINEIILKLSETDREKLFPKNNCTMKQTLRSLKVLKSNKMFLDDSTTQIVLDGFIQQIELYEELFSDKYIYYSLNVHTPNDQDYSMLSFEVLLNNHIIISGGSLRKIGIDKRESCCGWLMNVTTLSELCIDDLSQKYDKNKQKPKIRVYIQQHIDDELRKMIGLYFTRSGFELIEKGQCQGNYCKIYVNHFDKPYVSFDDIEFGSIMFSMVMFNGDWMVSSKTNIDIFNIIETLNEYDSFNEYQEEEDISELFLTFKDELIIPLLPINSEISSQLLKKSFKEIKSMIQKEKHVDINTFNKLCDNIKSVKTFINNQIGTKIVLMYSTIDNEYIPCVINKK